MAVPLKHQLINIDQLPFPTGTATAETLKGIHSAGNEAMQKAKALFGAAIFGVLAGVLICVPIYTIVVKTPPKDQPAQVAGATPAETNLGSAQLPAPAAKVWAAVAEVLNKGLSGLPKGTGWAMLVGGFSGVLITLGEEFAPRRYVKWIPSATGLGIAGVVPAFNSISMFLGALGAWIWSKAHAESAKKYLISGSSGLIAGESLMGVAVILWLEGPELILAVFGS